MNNEAVKIPILGARRNDPFIFRTFFEMGLEESASPFLNPRARRISRNLTLKTSLLAAFLLALSYAINLFPFSEIILIAVYVIAGVPPLIDSIEDIVFRRDVNIDVLMTIAAFGAYFLGAGFEGALLLVLFAISGALETLVTLRAKNALSQVHSLAPTKAYMLKSDQHLIERAVEDVQVGSLIVVRAGEIVPLDGIIVDGAASLDMSHLTGESKPFRKKVDDLIPSGARVLDAAITIRVTSPSSESTVAKIIQLITKAQESRPRLERWFDRFGRSYALTIITAACVSTIYFAYEMNLPYFAKEGAIYRSLAFLITASPCALILAVPIAYLSSLGSLARKGIVLKGGVVLDAINDASLIAFDKTGTLTFGNLIFHTIVPIKQDSLSDIDVISIAASLERNSTHPIAKALVREAQSKEIHFVPLDNVKVVPGLGVEGSLKTQKALRCFIGDIKAAATFLDREAAQKVETIGLQKQSQGYVVALCVIGDAHFIFCFEDEPRPDVKAMLERLRKSGRRLVMLTGDSKAVASQIAKLVGIDEYYAELSPQGKLDMITKLSAEKGLIMVGDGINDAPALALASVGVCMGRIGSGAAQEAADCVLLNDNIEQLDILVEKATKTRKIVKQNLILALSAIIFASIPALYGIVPLWLAVILHEGGTVLVGMNAIRLLRN